MSQDLEKMKCELIDHIDRALITKADEIPNSWSKVIYGLTTKLDDYIELNDKRWARIEPYIKEAEDARKFKEDIDAKASKFAKWGARWLVFTAIVSSIYYGIKHIK